MLKQNIIQQSKTQSMKCLKLFLIKVRESHSENKITYIYFTKQ